MRLSITLPDALSSNEKGDFFEQFVADLVRPMRLMVTQRVSFTGMEIDLLAKDEDQPRTILIECKAHSDPLGSEVITKLLGTRSVRKADAAWLFSTADLTKGGRGLTEEISGDEDLARTFAWFPAHRICELLIGQGKVREPRELVAALPDADLGDWTLVVNPAGHIWLVEVIEGGLPASVAAFDGRTGTQLTALDYADLGLLADRYCALPFVPPTESRSERPFSSSRAPVARVTSGDTWEDPRPSRPIDFVGRDDVIRDVSAYLEAARTGATQTRTFALQARSGWGKSSLVIKLADLAGKGRTLRSCSITAVDSRSATSSAFIAEAIQLAFADAAKRSLVRKNQYDLSSVSHPLQSPSLAPAYEDLAKSSGLIVLIFDQFEELFAKEQLFEAFNAVRELALDLDSTQVPLVLGFAWKTDIALPQQHPAYHLWHELRDRRRTFGIPEFGTWETRRVVTKAERALGKRLSPALRARLVEQCQGLPWLLKKLLVHVLQRVTTAESQYLLLERELDVEVLFREDLAALPEEAIRCLRHIAATAPIAVPEVEENFGHETTNMLLGSRLIVRSGMNYVIYWDIFRDYLIDGKVPQIPWGRTFQRDPKSGVRAIQALDRRGALTALGLARELGLKEGTCFNMLGDLVALQLVDRTSDRYSVGGVLDSTDPATIAGHARGQLSRHVVAKAIDATWPRGQRVSPESWVQFFASVQPHADEFAAKTNHYYAANLRRWLLFSGLLDRTGGSLVQPIGPGTQMGVLTGPRARTGIFLASTSPTRLIDLLDLLSTADAGVTREDLESHGLRNAVADGVALGLVEAHQKGRVRLAAASTGTSVVALAQALVHDPVVSFVRDVAARSDTSVRVLGDELEGFLDTTWAESSKRRYANGLLRYARWLGAHQKTPGRTPLGGVSKQHPQEGQLELGPD